jgi:alpha-galactosidase
MTNKTKIVFIGATSMSFGMNMLRDVFSSKELHGSTLTMVSRNSETLSKWAGIAKRLKKTSGAGLIVEHTTDRRAAFDGAGFVVNADQVYDRDTGQMQPVTGS